MNKRLPYNDYKWKKNDQINRKNQIGDLVLNLKSIPNGSKNWNFYAKGMNEYVADHQELLTLDGALKPHNKNIDAHGSYLSYMSRDSAKKDDDLNPSNHIWHYTNLKQYGGKDVSTFDTKSNKARFTLSTLDEVRKIHNKSHIWSIVISERDLDMKNIMFENQHKIVDRVIRAMFDFPVDATCAFHGNTEHPHIHIMVYQPDIMKDEHIRKKWKIKENRLESAKKSYFYFMINNKDYFKQLLVEKSKLRELYNGEVLQRVMQKEFVDLLKVLSKDKQPWLDNDGNPKYSNSGEPLYQMKFQFNRLNNDSKQAVEQLKDFILNLETANKEISDFQEQYRRFRGIGSKLIEDEFSKLPDKKKESLVEKTNELFNEADEKICQQLLKTAKQFYLENYHLINGQDNDFNSWINHGVNSNEQKIDQERRSKKYKEYAEDKKVVIPPAINKILAVLSQDTFKDMYKNLGHDFDLNKNLTALKALMRQLEAERLDQ